MNRFMKISYQPVQELTEYTFICSCTVCSLTMTMTSIAIMFLQLCSLFSMYIPQTLRPLKQSRHSWQFRQKKRRNDPRFRFMFRKRMRDHNPLACFLPTLLFLACQPSRLPLLAKILQPPSQQKGNTNLRLFSVITKYFLEVSFKIHAL
jgi:hypothetical protein